MLEKFIELLTKELGKNNFSIPSTSEICIDKDTLPSETVNVFDAVIKDPKILQYTPIPIHAPGSLQVLYLNILVTSFSKNGNNYIIHCTKATDLSFINDCKEVTEEIETMINRNPNNFECHLEKDKVNLIKHDGIPCRIYVLDATVEELTKIQQFTKLHHEKKFIPIKLNIDHMLEKRLTHNKQSTLKFSDLILSGIDYFDPREGGVNIFPYVTFAVDCRTINYVKIQ